jgi:hypothetical protein
MIALIHTLPALPSETRTAACSLFRAAVAAPSDAEAFHPSLLVTDSEPVLTPIYVIWCAGGLDRGTASAVLAYSLRLALARDRAADPLLRTGPRPLEARLRVNYDELHISAFNTPFTQEVRALRGGEKIRGSHVMAYNVAASV